MPQQKKVLSDLKAMPVSEPQKPALLSDTGTPATISDPKRHAELKAIYETIQQYAAGKMKFDPLNQNPLMQKLHNSSMRDIVWALGELADHIRLEEGKATENIAISKRVALVMSDATGQTLEGKKKAIEIDIKS